MGLGMGPCKRFCNSLSGTLYGIVYGTLHWIAYGTLYGIRCGTLNVLLMWGPSVEIFCTKQPNSESMDFVKDFE